MTDKLTTCLWFDGNGEEAIQFYAGLFPQSSIDSVNTAPSDWPGGSQGDVLTVEATILGSPMLALNGGEGQQFSEAISLMVPAETQADVDRYWHMLTADGGEAMMCGWCKDRFGVRWQVVPPILMQSLRDTDISRRKRVFDAMGQMVKFDIAQLEAAYRGDAA